MTREQLDFFLTDLGYIRIESNLPEYSIYFRVEHQGINALSVIDCSAYNYMTEDNYVFVKQKVRDHFKAYSDKDVHILSLIIGDNVERNRTLCLEDPFCWLILPTRNQLIIYETQTPDFYGLKSEIEKFLQNVTAGQFYINEEHMPVREKALPQNLSWGVISLLVLNVLMFILCAFTGNLLYNIGDLSVVNVIRDHAYYRIISSMFLHLDINHLFSNMLILYYIGDVVEKQLGHGRFIILYFVCGILGNIASMFYELVSGSYFHSVGASGAVFGMMGALLFLVLIYKGKFRQMSYGRVLFMIAFSLYTGFTSANVNNAAHLGGLLAGFVFAGLLWITIRKDRRRYEG